MPQRGFNARIRLHECPQETAEAQEFGIEDCPDSQASADLMTKRGGHALDVAGGRQGSLGVRQERFAVSREDQAMRRPRKQRDAQGFLQCLICRLTAGCDTCNNTAARVRLPSRATVTKARRRVRSISDISAAYKAVEDIDWIAALRPQ